MDIVQYHYLRECELEAALAETRADLAGGAICTGIAGGACGSGKVHNMSYRDGICTTVEAP